MNEFWNHEINVGYYDKIVKIGINKKRGARAYWHITTLKTIKTYLLKNLIHLDYACGPGTLIGKYSNSISTGVDISKKQIEYAKKNYFEKGTFLTTNEFNFEDYEDQYDVITLLGLIEFLNNDEINNLFVKLNKLLKNDGKIVLTTPNFSGIMKILEFLQNSIGSVDYQEQHINKFSKLSLEDLLNKQNLFNFQIYKFLNFSFIFSIFSHNFAWKMENLVNKIFKNYFGSLFVVILTKKNNPDLI